MLSISACCCMSSCSFFSRNSSSLPFLTTASFSSMRFFSASTSALLYSSILLSIICAAFSVALRSSSAALSVVADAPLLDFPAPFGEAGEVGPGGVFLSLSSFLTRVPKPCVPMEMYCAPPAFMTSSYPPITALPMLSPYDLAEMTALRHDPVRLLSALFHPCWTLSQLRVNTPSIILPAPLMAPAKPFTASPARVKNVRTAPHTDVQTAIPPAFSTAQDFAQKL